MFAKSIATKGGDVFRDEKSLAFDGTNDYVETSFVPDYISTNATTAFWIKMNDFSGSQRMGNHRDKRWYHGFDGTDIHIGVANTHNGSSLITPTPALVVGQWFHYCVTAIDGTATVYINGVAQGTMSYTQSSSTDPETGYFIGAQDASGGVTVHMNGNISEVVHYNVGLTANQVKTIYNGREPYNHKEGVASGNLQAWYRMGDGVLDSKHLAETDTQAISDMVTPTLGNDLFDADAYASGTGGWEVYSNNTVENDSGAIKITYVDSASGAYLYLRNAKDLSSDLTVGKLYKIKFDAKVNTGSVTFEVVTASGSNGPTWVVTNTDFSTIEGYFKAGHTTNCYLRAKSMGAGEIAYWNNITLQEVGGNAAIMQNMSNVDFEGDTP